MDDAEKWFSVPSSGMAVGAPGPDGLAPGFAKARAFAQDIADRPHATYARDMLMLACREHADLFVKVANEDGDSNALADAFYVLVTRSTEAESTHA